ncbi:hypothetical protein LAZ40_04260 [Cereibacter sphaeroides]|nr:hypothetical protein [Cereibacter sphaeroides]
MTLATPQGYRGLFWLVPFSGHGDGMHRFADHAHARNFVRYLFSQSKAHPSSAATGRNFHREYGDDARTLREGYVRDPKGMLEDFLRRRFPRGGAHELLMDDGCYPFFLLQCPGQPLTSNFARRTGTGAPLRFEHPLLPVLKTFLRHQGVRWEDEEAKLRAFAGRDPIVDFGREPEGPLVRTAETLLHGVVRKLLGGGRDVVMTVAHRDQPGHNPNYHIHRLLRTSPVAEEEGPSP